MGKAALCGAKRRATVTILYKLALGWPSASLARLKHMARAIHATLRCMWQQSSLRHFIHEYTCMWWLFIPRDS